MSKSKEEWKDRTFPKFYEGQTVFRIHQYANSISINKAIIIKIKPEFNSIIASILGSPVEDMRSSSTFDMSGISRSCGRIVTDIDHYLNKWKEAGDE